MTLTSSLLTRLLQLLLLRLALTSSIGGPQGQFDNLVKTADELFSETKHTAASVAVLRAALLLCADCKAGRSKGRFSEGVFVFDQFPDRVYLSETLFPALRLYGTRHILWVGVQPYTLRGVQQLTRDGAEVTTIEPDGKQAVYGSAYRHITAPLQDLFSHVPPESFDAVIINGVLGWGIDGEAAVRQALRVMYEALTDSGILLVGWNRGMGACCDFDPWFLPRGLSGLPASYDVPGSETKHVYATFRKNDRHKAHIHASSNWGDT